MQMLARFSYFSIHASKIAVRAMMMKKMMLAAAAVCAMASGAAMAQEAQSPWQVRLRAVHLDSANKDFTPNIAAELVLTYPQKHDLRSDGAKIGTLKHLPPSLLAQYHFTNMGAFKPYLGAGVNYTRFSNVNFAPAVEAALDPSIKKNSFGSALQIGFDYMLDKNWSINVDVKKVYIKTDVRSAGTKVGTFKVDPWLLGVGVGYRF